MKNYRLKRKLDKDVQENDKNVCNKKKKQEYMKQYRAEFKPLIREKRNKINTRKIIE